MTEFKISHYALILTMNIAYFACGCFWGVQYQFSRLKGVQGTYTGYMGGQLDTPTYQSICTGKTGHKETVKIIYDPQIIDYTSLLQFFFEIHDFQQTDGQGPDIGDQYLSVIFTCNEKQQKQAGQMLEVLKNMGYRPATQILPAGQFWIAEDYHQHYYEKTGHQPYCHLHRKIFDRTAENGG